MKDDKNRSFRAPSVYVLMGLTPECDDWITENVDPMGEQKGGVTVEHRYIDDIVDGLKDAGFQDKVDFWIYF